MEPSPGKAVTVAALTVLYNNSVHAIERTIDGFDNSVRLGRSENLCTRFVLALGDASPLPVLTGDDLSRLRSSASHIELDYTFFNENTGTSKGQNKLSRLTDSDLVLLCNPDVIPDARAVEDGGGAR